MNAYDSLEYKTYLRGMKEDALSLECETVVKQNENAMMRQLCYNECLDRGKGAIFIDAYNKAIGGVKC